MIRLIGFYDYTVVLTYLSLISSVFGITQAIHGNYKWAILCLALSGFCDAFDGRVARTKKDRDEDEKSFGVQLDSLCDVICFGVFFTHLLSNGRKRYIRSYPCVLFLYMRGCSFGIF